MSGHPAAGGRTRTGRARAAGMRAEPDAPAPAHAHAHDLIVIGGSAGAVEAVSEIVAALPETLPAAVCVVLHQAPYQPSRLAEILDRLGPLRAVRARAGAPLRRGTIHVAIPDHHLLVERAEGGAADAFGVLRLTHGPKETRARPAVDVLFRSAALAFGPRVIGVVLSGALDDGTAGLWAIRDRGGLAVVQDPEDATVASMPANALAEVGADHVARAREIARLLVELSRRPVEPATPAAGSGPAGEPTAQLAREVRVAAIDEATHRAPTATASPHDSPAPSAAACSGR